MAKNVSEAYGLSYSKSGLLEDDAMLTGKLLVVFLLQVHVYALLAYLHIDRCP